MYKICHRCEENETDITCDQCDEYVCEDCCVVMTIQNQVDYPLCLGCEENNETERFEESARVWEQEEADRKKKEKRAIARHAAYWKPDAVKKRRLKKIERKRLKSELARKRAAEASRIVGSMFKGMF